MRITTRRLFGPVVVIHAREGRKRSTFGAVGPSPELSAPARAGEPPLAPLELGPSLEPTSDDSFGSGAAGGVVEVGTLTAVVATGAGGSVGTVVGAVGTVVGTVGTVVGKVGTVIGTVTTGVETVTVGTVGTGTVSPSAWPASTPAASNRIVAAAALISQQLIWARIGCGVCAVRDNGRGMAAVQKRDYYEVLEVERDADPDAIKRAFHALARDWHPDVSNSPDAEARFRELAEAYAVLSKQERRLLYDRYGYRGRGNQGFDEALWEARPVVAKRGEDVHIDVELRSFEAVDGARRVVNYRAAVRCKACMGRGSVGLPDPECELCGGTGRRRQTLALYFSDLLQIEECPECVGEKCRHCLGDGIVESDRRIRLLVPPGVDDGAQLRVGAEGHDLGAGSIPGDLLVRVKVVTPRRDPRIVRYVALALLLVAVATLVLYVH